MPAKIRAGAGKEKDMFNEFPVLQLRLSGLGKEFCAAFSGRVGEFEGYVFKAVDTILSNESLQNEIDKLINGYVQEALRAAICSYDVQEELKKIILEKLRAPAEERQAQQTTAA